MYVQSNGQLGREINRNNETERCIQTAKQVLKKAESEGVDIAPALLEYQNTLLSSTPFLSVQMVMGRALWAKIIVADQKLLRAMVRPQVHLESRKRRQKAYQDRVAK